MILRTLPDVVLLKHVNKLRERGGYPHALLVFNALISLEKHLLDNKRKVCPRALVLDLAEVHKYRYKGSLSVSGKESYDLVLNTLNALFDLLAQSFLGNLGYGTLVVHSNRRKLLSDACKYLLTADVYEGGEVRQ